MGKERADKELEVFHLFAQALGLPISEGSVEKRKPPEPDIKGPKGNPWGIKFMTMFHMSNDSHLFRTYEQLSAVGAQKDGVNWVGLNNEVWAPLYEAKMVYFYDHRAASYAERGNERGYRVLPDTTDDQHVDTNFETQPYYWVNQNEINSRVPSHWRHSWMLGFKNVTSSTN